MSSKPRFFAQLTLAFVLGLSACASLGTSSTPTLELPTSTPLPPTATPPPSVATVNGEYITIAEFQSELERYKAAQTALGLSFTDEDAGKAVLEDLIAQVLLSQAARAANFTLTEADLQSRIDALAAQLGSADALSQWQSAHGYDDASFRFALKRSIEAAWMRDKIIADVPTVVEQIHVRQILTYNEVDARAALDEIKAGADFDEKAAFFDPVTFGELGWVPRGYLLDPLADEALFALQPGMYTDVIATDAGFHIFKAVERGEHPLTPDALLTVQELAIHTWLAEQRAKSEITLIP
ncbi:SurA N-terminal domain-containing protein [Candidatus Villigracilis affinis]|uniref:peptidylprolyl isomerase n=1 Tax=Candidatus Villigracilis affinis TaxID=3140682 RepID=UPI002A1B8ABF|nr:SurA N-terminal domain-containing protein [Anaerolineales bacterium]